MIARNPNSILMSFPELTPVARSILLSKKPLNSPHSSRHSWILRTLPRSFVKISNLAFWNSPHFTTGTWSCSSCFLKLLFEQLQVCLFCVVKCRDFQGKVPLYGICPLREITDFNGFTEKSSKFSAFSTPTRKGECREFENAEMSAEKFDSKIGPATGVRPDSNKELATRN